jgi:two-component system, NtrC family, sensor kinase
MEEEIRILYVDEEPNDLNSLRRLLLDDDLKVTIANAVERYYLFKKNTELIKVNAELKELLAEKSELLELEGKMLEASQTILFSLPVAVLGISENIVIQCNKAWAEDTGDQWVALGKSVRNALPADVVEFLHEVQDSRISKKRITMNGVTGHIFGSVIRGDDKTPKSIILVYIRGDLI